MKHVVKPWAIALCVLIGAMLAGPIQTTVRAEAPAQKPSLMNADCAKCHPAQAGDIEANGKAHKDAIGCQDCHTGHRPASKSNIPKCGSCHSDKPHFQLPNCLGCHSNPHTPKIITFGKQVTEPCLTCHTEQIKQLKTFPSKHSKLYCSFCHDVHGKIPQCTQCHKPHSGEMTAADCKKCHKAHQPLNVTYADTTPNKDCGACHKKAHDMLSASSAKHKTLACAYCHKTKHRTVPKCQDCHGSPHPAGIMAKFPKCGECHNIAHDLNNWPPKAEAAPAKPAVKKK